MIDFVLLVDDDSTIDDALASCRKQGGAIPTIRRTYFYAILVVNVAVAAKYSSTFANTVS